MADDVDDYDNDQFKKDMKTAMAFSLLESYRGSGMGHLSLLDKPIAVDDITDCSKDDDLDSAADKLLLASSCRKIDDVLSSIDFCSESLPMELADKKSMHMGSLSKRRLYSGEEQVVPAKRVKLSLSRSSSYCSYSLHCSSPTDLTGQYDYLPNVNCQKIISRRSSANSTNSQGSNMSQGDSFRHSDLHEEIRRSVHVTRRQSRELNRILYRTPRDKNSIRHQLDPTIFDAEVSSEDDSDFDCELLPEEKEEIKSILLPRSLNDDYNEMDELHDFESDDLPDLDNVAETSVSDVCLRSRHHTITPVFDKLHLDKLQMNPIVKLKRITDPEPRVTKKLKLKGCDSMPDSSLNQSRSSNILPNSSTFSLSKFTWNQEHNSRLRSIISKVLEKSPVLEDVEPSLPPCTNIQDLINDTVESIENVRNHDNHEKSSDSCNSTATYIENTLSMQDAMDCVGVDHDAGQESMVQRVAKPWGVDNEYSSSDSDSDISSSEEGYRETLREDARLRHVGIGRVVATAVVKKLKRKSVTIIPRSVLGLGHSLTYPLETGSKLEVNHLKPLSTIIADLIENSEIDDEQFQLRYLQMCRSYLNGHSQWPMRIQKQLMELMLNGASPSVFWGAYDILNSILFMSIPSGLLRLAFDWDRLEAVVDRLDLSNGKAALNPDEILPVSLTLQYMISVLELQLQVSTSQLLQHSSLQHRHFTKCHAYHWLSLEHGFSHMRNVIKWLLASLSFGHYSCSMDTKNFGRSNSKTCNQQCMTWKDIPKVMPLFQRLFNLGVVVSQNRYDNVQRIVIELARGYISQPQYDLRHQLISSIKAPAIINKVCHRILDSYCLTTSEDHLVFPFTLRHLLKHCCTFSPPILSLASPATVISSDDHFDLKHSKLEDLKKTYSAANVEELAFLTSSFICNYVRTIDLEEEQETMKKILSYVHTLEDHYQSLTTEITCKTKVYLMMIEGLSSLQPR